MRTKIREAKKDNRRHKDTQSVPLLPSHLFILYPNSVGGSAQKAQPHSLLGVFFDIVAHLTLYWWVFSLCSCSLTGRSKVFSHRPCFQHQYHRNRWLTTSDFHAASTASASDSQFCSSNVSSYPTHQNGSGQSLIRSLYSSMTFD